MCILQGSLKIEGNIIVQLIDTNTLPVLIWTIKFCRNENLKLLRTVYSIVVVYSSSKIVVHWSKLANSDHSSYGDLIKLV